MAGAGRQPLHSRRPDGALPQTAEPCDCRADSCRFDIPVELGGGIRTLEQAIDEVRVARRAPSSGSAVIRDPELVKTACAKYGDRIVVGIDAKDGIVAVDGWASR